MSYSRGPNGIIVVILAKQLFTPDITTTLSNMVVLHIQGYMKYYSINDILINCMQYV